VAITIIGTGAADSSVAYTPGFAGPVLADDILLILVEQASLTSPEVSPSATGFAHVLSSPVGPNSSATVLSVLWKRAVGGETSVTATGPSNHGTFRAITIRGVKNTGNPWHVSPAVATEADAVDAGATWPTATTTVDGCLVLLCIATGRDVGSTANLGAVTGSSLSSVTEQMDNWVSSGTGGGIGLVTGFKDTAGNIGTPVATMGSTDGKALMTLVLEPAAVGGGATNAPAEQATGSGAADTPAAAAAVAAEATSGTGQATDPTADVRVAADLATGTGIAGGPAVAVEVLAEVATGTGTAPDATVQIPAGTVIAQNTFEGGLANGTTVTTVNSGGAAGNAFDATQSGTAPPKIDTATFAHGTRSLKIELGVTAAECYVAWTEVTLGAAVLTRPERLYLRFDANPSSIVRVLRWMSQATARASVQVTTAGKLQVVDSTGTARGTSVASIPLGAWFRVEAKYVSDGTNATVEVRHWTTQDSTGTPTETFTSSSFTGGGTTDRTRAGHTGTAVASVTYWLDDWASGTGDFLGPLVATGAPAEAATGTGVAPDAAVAVDALADQAVGTGVAGAAADQVDAPAGLASGVGVAGDATTVSPFGRPTGLVVVPVSSTRIDLFWNNVQESAGYDIERDGTIIATDVHNTTYSDTAVSGGTGYTYRVRAVYAPAFEARRDLLYGTEIGAWREDGTPAVTEASGIPAKVREAGVSVIRFAVHDTFSDLLDPLGAAGEVSRANFRNAIGGITNNLKCIPWVKMLPISLQAIETKTGERWIPPWTGTIPSIWLDTYKAVLTELRQVYSGPVIIESHNEMHYNAWSVWRDRDGALDTSTGLPLTGAGNTGISKRIGEHWAQTMPELKRYCRDVLRFSRVFVGGEVGVSGGSGWGQSITPDGGQPYGYAAGYQTRWVDEFNTAIKTAYDAAPAADKPLYIPDFESIHCYPHSPDFTAESAIYQFDNNKAFAYYRQWIQSSRARVNLIWGSTIGNQILFANSEGTAGFSNDSGIWTGWQTAGQPEDWFSGWFQMMQGDGVMTGSGTRYWANIIFAIATDADGTAGTANSSSRYYNWIHFDGTVKSWYETIKQASLNDPAR